MLLTLLAIARAAPEGTEDSASKEKDVKPVTGADFDQFIQENKVAFVRFGTNWCGHCKALEPKLVALGQISEGFAVGRVECTSDAALCNAESVRGYPTLRLYVGGKFVEQYKGAREADAMKQWILEKSKQ